MVSSSSNFTSSISPSAWTPAVVVNGTLANITDICKSKSAPGEHYQLDWNKWYTLAVSDNITVKTISLSGMAYISASYSGFSDIAFVPLITAINATVEHSALTSQNWVTSDDSRCASFTVTGNVTASSGTLTNIMFTPSVEDDVPLVKLIVSKTEITFEETEVSTTTTPASTTATTSPTATTSTTSTTSITATTSTTVPTSTTVSSTTTPTSGFTTIPSSASHVNVAVIVGPVLGIALFAMAVASIVFLLGRRGKRRRSPSSEKETVPSSERSRPTPFTADATSSSDAPHITESRMHRLKSEPPANVRSPVTGDMAAMRDLYGAMRSAGFTVASLFDRLLHTREGETEPSGTMLSGSHAPPTYD